MAKENENPAKIKIDPAKLKRTQHATEESAKVVSQSVSQGSVDKVIDLAFNPTREKIREVTIIDRVQGRLLPQLDIIGLVWQYAIEIATFRQDGNEYERLYKKKLPTPPNLLDEFTYRTAQWQKSVAGKNLERATDIALAETETRSEGEDFDDKDAWGKE